jgi:hypothetical protein
MGITMGDDTWNQGGSGVYRVTLRRDEAGRLEGMYEGTFEANALSGRATGVMKPARPSEGPPIRPGERPRLLLREADLPRLRARLATPFGQAYRDLAYQSNDCVNWGLLYALTGDKGYADEAMRIIEGYGEDLVCDQGWWGSGGYGHRFVRVAAALDLCYGAWPADFRRQLIERIVALLPEHQQRIMISHPNPHPCSNYYGPGRGSPAIAALALWGEKGPERPPPEEPGAGAVALGPPKDFTPGEGVPVNEWAPGRVPGQWIAAGPLTVKLHIDMIESIVDPPRARPQVGSSHVFVTLEAGQFQQVRVTYGALAQGAAGAEGVDTAALGAPDKPRSLFLFAALRLAAGRDVALVRGSPDTRVYLAGVELADGQVYRLAAGLYPLLVIHATARAGGRIAPRLVDVEADATIGPRLRYDVALATWRADHDLRERLGGADPAILRFFDVGFHQVYQHYRLGIGDGGFQAETGSYADIASWLPLVYAAMYRRAFGRDASGYPDATYLVPRRMMQVYFPQSGKPEAHKINSAVGLRADFCAAAFPIVPDRYKPGVLWAWNRVKGVSGGAGAAAVLQNERGLDLAHAFVNYPLDVPGFPAEVRPEHPAKAMPLQWEAPTFGYYGFRSGWEGRDEFISQVFAKASLIKGWNHPNAGTFRIFGLGRPWVAGSYERVGFRLQEPVVLLPEDTINEGACGRVAYLRTEKDGSAALTVDLKDVYSRPASLYDRNLLPAPERFVESGISGLRAFAFDHSGASGAPCLAAIVDRIRGGKRKLWLWPLPAGALGRVQVRGGGFAIDYGDASMNVTFVSPADVRVEAVGEDVAVGDLANGHASLQGRLERVKAGAGEAGEYFVVATFQRGPAPPVQVAGRGLDAVVTVGGRTVRFDGEKVVLGTAQGG